MSLSCNADYEGTNLDFDQSPSSVLLRPTINIGLKKSSHPENVSITFCSGNHTILFPLLQPAFVRGEKSGSAI